ncbi:hypothetical protein BDZ97DRAFT_1921405 [Flammula alnicola]|nr:hypothetical protein BDZ97DRAFT_1921405 [Flammula alnicola]
MASDTGEQDVVMSSDHPIHPPPAPVSPMAWPSEISPVVMMEKFRELERREQQIAQQLRSIHAVIARAEKAERQVVQLARRLEDIESVQSHGASNAAVIPPASSHVPDRQTSMLEDEGRGSNSSVIYTHQIQTTAAPANLGAVSIMREGELGKGKERQQVKPQDEDMTDEEAEIQAILTCAPSQDPIYLATARFPRSIIGASPVLALKNRTETSTVGPPGDFQTGPTPHGNVQTAYDFFPFGFQLLLVVKMHIDAPKDHPIHPPSASYSALDVLPTHIWLNILDQIMQHLPQATLFDFSLTCQAFRGISLPLIYRTLIFHPFAIEGHSREHWKRSEWSPLPPIQTSHAVQCLDFYSCNRIANYVRHLDLRPRLPSNKYTPKLPVETPDDLDFLVRKFYEAVPRFTNTQSFVCTSTEIDAFALHQLSQLPNLRDMDLGGCNLLSSAMVGRSLRLSTFKFWHMAMPDELATVGVDRWLAMLDPDSLEFVRVGPARASTLFFQDILSAGPFKSLSTIEIAIMSEQMLACIPLLLSKTPALRHLQLPLFGSIPGEGGKRVAEGLKSPFESSTPDLEDYHGPHELLHVILPRSPGHSALHRLQLDSLGRNGEPFSVCLQSLSLPAHSFQLTNVTEFSTEFISIECDDLAKLFVLLPNLRDLELSLQFKLTFRGQNITKETFLDDVLKLSLPSQLRSLSFDWTASDSVDVNSKHRKVQAELITRLPLLERLWLCDWMKSAYLWYRTTSGRELSTVYKTGTLQNNSDAADELRRVFSRKF